MYKTCMITATADVCLSVDCHYDTVVHCFLLNTKALTLVLAWHIVSIADVGNNTESAACQRFQLRSVPST